jgi:hypothetical protein
LKQGAAGEHSGLASMMMVSMDGIGSGNAEDNDDDDNDDGRNTGAGSQGGSDASEGSPFAEDGSSGVRGIWQPDSPLADAATPIAPARAFQLLSPHRAPGAATPPDDDADVDDEVVALAALLGFGTGIARPYNIVSFLWMFFFHHVPSQSLYFVCRVSIGAAG